MKADELAKELLDHKKEDDEFGEYKEVFIRNNKLIVDGGDDEKNYTLLDKNRPTHKKMEKDKIDKIIKIAKYYGDIGNTKRDIYNFSAEIIELLKGSDE